MKLQDSDPPRLADGSPSEIGRLVRLSSNQRMTSATTARIAQRLEAAGAFASAPPPAGLGSRSLFERIGTAKIAGLALVGLGGALLVWQSQTSERSVAPPAPSATPSVLVAARPTGPTVEKTPTEETAPIVSVDALPSPAPVPNAPASRTASAARPSAPHSSSSPSPASTNGRPLAAAGDEFALIRSAQSALASDPVRALAIVDEHARTYASGELVQERELTAVEALAHLGRKDEAKKRAQALVARFPRTPYVARLERAVGEPLSPVLTPSRAP